MLGLGGQNVLDLALRAASDQSYTCVTLVTALTDGVATTTVNQQTIDVGGVALGTIDGLSRFGTATVTITTTPTPRVVSITDHADQVALTFTYPNATPTFDPPPVAQTLTATQAAALH